MKDSKKESSWSIGSIFYATRSTNERKLHKEAKLAKKKIELGMFIVDQYIYSTTFPKLWLGHICK